MKKKSNKNKNPERNKTSKMMNSNKNNTTINPLNTENSGSNSEDQNTNYPSDIQGLFERLGIE